MARNKGVQRKLYKNLQHKEKKSHSEPTPSEQPTKKKEKKKVPRHSHGYTGIAGAYIKWLRPLMIIPFILLVLACAQIGMQYSTTGDFFRKDVSLEGGLTVTVQMGDIDIAALESFLGGEFGNDEVSVRELKKQGVQFGVIAEASSHIDEDAMLAAIEQKLGKLDKDQYSIEITGSALGSSFFRQLLFALLLAFGFMGLVVLLYFRSLVPAGAVILAALSDIIMTLAVINVMGVKLSSAGIAAFLMLIGYSVDTDILLSTRVLKNTEGNLYSRIFGAMKPGILMGCTTLVVVGCGLIFSQSETLKQIMLILFIGLVLDLLNTWIQNAGIISWYVERKNRG